MKRFLLGLAAVVAIVLGTSLTNSAMAQGPRHGHGGYGHGGHGHGHRHSYCAPPPPCYGGHGGYYGGYSHYRPNYGGYGYGGGYGYRNSSVIQLYGPRGGFTLGF